MPLSDYLAFLRQDFWEFDQRLEANHIFGFATADGVVQNQH